MRTEQEQLELYREQLEKEKYEYEQYVKEEQEKALNTEFTYRGIDKEELLNAMKEVEKELPNPTRTKEDYQKALDNICCWVVAWADCYEEKHVLQELIDNIKENK